MSTIDAHQHVWDLSRAEYAWLGPDAGALNRSFGMAEVLPELARAGIEGSILVQSADNDEDTDYLLETAASTAEVVGVVGYVPLHDAARTAARLSELQRAAKFCGIRNLIHERPDPWWLLRPDVDEGLSLLEHAGVPFDVAGVSPQHLRAVLTVSERHPELLLVLDHLNKPPVGRASNEPWASLITDVAQNPRVFGKVSALYSTVGDPGDWSVDAIRPLFDHALEAFGPARLMYGGDWPVSTIAGGYARVHAGISELLAPLDPADRHWILGGTAAAFYRIPELETPHD